MLNTHKKDELSVEASALLEERTIAFSDKSTLYIDIADYVELHITEKPGEETTKETLKWTPIAISNAKWSFLGNYHKIKEKTLTAILL